MVRRDGTGCRESEKGCDITSGSQMRDEAGIEEWHGMGRGRRTSERQGRDRKM